MLKELLESKLGPLEDAEFYFALEQLAANQAMTDIGTLDELSTNIDFYRREVARYAKNEETRQPERLRNVGSGWRSSICNKDICYR
jgi:hypothetical protein